MSRKRKHCLSLACHGFILRSCGHFPVVYLGLCSQSGFPLKQTFQASCSLYEGDLVKQRPSSQSPGHPYNLSSPFQCSENNPLQNSDSLLQDTSRTDPDKRLPDDTWSEGPWGRSPSGRFTLCFNFEVNVKCTEMLESFLPHTNESPCPLLQTLTF